MVDLELEPKIDPKPQEIEHPHLLVQGYRCSAGHFNTKGHPVMAQYMEAERNISDKISVQRQIRDQPGIEGHILTHIIQWKIPSRTEQEAPPAQTQFKGLLITDEIVQAQGKQRMPGNGELNSQRIVQSRVHGKQLFFRQKNGQGDIDNLPVLNIFPNLFAFVSKYQGGTAVG
ncbi:MAG TPA: hypothetical protein PK766_10140, partial [Bacteroidales bacterium]|nr:hypothetical protein [Bacteroidales bacterium]